MTEENTNQTQRQMSGWLSGLLFFGAVALLVAGIMWLYPDSSSGEAVEDTTTTSTTLAEVEVTTQPSVAATDEPVAAAAEVILPSVVHIQTQGGVGSGVVYDADGLIATAAHVVQGEDTVRVRFADGEQVSGTVLGTAAPDADIAVIEVDRQGLTPATFAEEKPRAGQMAVAVGSPWGFESTVTAGIVSAVDQTNCALQPDSGQFTCSSMVQTDAAINPGNSGGALVDRDGHVIGINVSIISGTGANDGVGFAVPSALATTYANAIISGDPIEAAFLGVSLAPGDVATEGQAGAVVDEIIEDTAAAEAGLEVGDVVIALDGVPVLGGDDLQAQVRAHQPGESVEMRILRNGEEITVQATLGVRTEDVS